MPRYLYTAKAHDGTVINSTVDATSRQGALSALRAKGVSVIVEIREDTGAARALSSAASLSAANPHAAAVSSLRVSAKDKAIFCRQLAISVGAGVPLREAIDSIAEDVEKSVLRRLLLAVSQALHEGRSFSEALAAHPRAFPTLFVALIRAAEEAGSMSQTLDQLASSLEKNERLARKLRSITAYPMFVMGFFLIVCGVMTLVVLPKFQASFSEFGSELPKITRVVFSANALLIHHSVVIITGLACIVAAAVFYVRTPAGRLRADAFKLRLPLFGPCIRKVAVARFCRNVAIMIRGGVPIATAIEIAAGVCGNKMIEQSLLGARQLIMNGADISSSLGHDGVLPRLAVRMVGVGESSGRLPEVLDKVSEGYEEEVEGAIMVATSLFEPVIIAVFGAVILVLVLAIYLPVFTAASHMK